MKKVYSILIVAMSWFLIVKNAHAQSSFSLQVKKMFPKRSEATAIRFSSDCKRLLNSGAIVTPYIPRAYLPYKKVLTLRELYKYKTLDKKLRVWDVSTGKQIWRLPTSPIAWERGANTLLMPDFKTMLTTWGAYGVQPIEIHSFRLSPVIKIYNGGINSLAFSPDQKILAIGMARSVEFRDPNSYAVISAFSHWGSSALVNFGPNDFTAVCNGWGGKPQAVDVISGKQIRYPRWFYRVRNSDAYAFAPEGNTLAMARGRNIEIWTTPREDAGKKLRSLTTRLNKINVLQFSPDGKTLAAGGESSTTTPVQFFKL